MNPSVILADEPTGNLDSRSGAEIMKLFNELNKEGVTIILVTHETAVANEARQVVTIKDGVCTSGCY
jgi:putative ABC transport system ATP-binding protein